MNDWKKLQIHLYRDLQKEAAQRVRRKSVALARYEKEFLDDQKKLTPDHLRHLIRAINKSDFLFVGDFHTLRQSQRFLLRLLRDRRLKKPRFLALEVLSRKALPIVNLWTKNPSAKNEILLRKSLQLEKHWGSHWETYRELFILCHELKIALIPSFDKSTHIRERDRLSALRLSTISERTWVFMGEYHCARQHLPLELLKLAPHKKIVVLQQNDDQATLRLLNEASKETSLILKAPTWTPAALRSLRGNGIDLFCALHTPLWIKYQSLLEHTLETEERGSGEILDASDQIQWSLKTLVKFLEDPRYPTKVNEHSLYHVHVYRSDDPHFYRSLAKLSRKEQRSMTQQLKTSGLAVSMASREIFLAEVTINSCSQAAGLYLYQAWSTNRLKIDGTYSLILLETLAFFLSKLLNHSRRASRLSQIPTELLDFHLLAPGSTKIEKIFRRNKWNLTLQFGRTLADMLFEAFLAGEFSRSRLIRLLKSPIKDENSAFIFLVEIYSVGRSFAKRSSKPW